MFPSRNGASPEHVPAQDRAPRRIYARSFPEWADVPFASLELLALIEGADQDLAEETDARFWPDWTDTPVEQLDLDQIAESGCEDGPESWPAWTDAPVEFIDYDSFDDSGRPTRKGGA